MLFTDRGYPVDSLLAFLLVVDLLEVELGDCLNEEVQRRGVLGLADPEPGRDRVVQRQVILFLVYPLLQSCQWTFELEHFVTEKC